jgi:nucleotide-binding universal stress UspA family protein
MTVKNILVAFNGSDGAVAALKYAASLAGSQGYVTAILAHATHEVVDRSAAWVPAKAREIIAQASEDILTAVQKRFEAVSADLDLGNRLVFQQVSGRVDAVLSECARSYDMLIAGLDQADDVDEHVSIHPDRIALMSGRPILLVPAGYDAKANHAHAALAWDGSRSAARALSDGLGLLEDQGQVTVLSVGDQNAPRPVEEVMEHLARHGIKGEHKQIKAEPGVARALLAWCRETDPCLLVMGAYEHSKFREDFLGGVTARVLKDTPIPVLLSH